MWMVSEMSSAYWWRCMLLVCQGTLFSVHLPGIYFMFLYFCQTLIIDVGSSLTLCGTDMFTLDRSFPTQTHTQHDSTCIVHTGSLIAHNYAIILIFACLKEPVILMYVCLCCEFVACDRAATGKFLLCHRRSKIFHCWKVRSKFAFVN